jgi:hypothetical protein
VGYRESWRASPVSDFGSDYEATTATDMIALVVDVVGAERDEELAVREVLGHGTGAAAMGSGAIGQV